MTPLKGTRLDIFLRAHTVKLRKSQKEQNERKKPKVRPERWPSRCLIIDTETRTSVDQALMFGMYRVCRLVDGEYRCEREGTFYSGETERGPHGYSAVLSKQELNAIGNFVIHAKPEIEAKSFPPHIHCEVHQTFAAFMEKVFWPFARKGYLIILFNAPWDLSRIARGFRPSYDKQGFTLIYKYHFSCKMQRWIADLYRPLIRIKPKDAKTAFITFGKTKRPEQWPLPPRVLDLSTILFSLFDKHMSLKAWGEEFRKLGYCVEDKDDHEPGGIVTLDELNHCRTDVRITQQYLNVARREFDRHDLTELLPNMRGLTDLLPDRSYSAASIGKAYLRKMAIIPPKAKFLELSNRDLGIAMQPYFGGRAEVHIRRTKVPVMRLDFVSQYPTGNTLMNLWDDLTAESVTFENATDEIREFLEGITLEVLFNKELWPKLKFFALVTPNHDIFPIRSPYNSKQPDKLNIGVNYLTSDKPIWMAGPDIVASIILNDGQIPHSLQAVRLTPNGKQEGMQCVKLMGEFPVNPYEEDFFKRIIELRKANEKNKMLKHALKIIANSTSYGCFVELNEILSCLSWKWRKRSSVKIAERTYEKRAQALHC
jgi:hypothetical protein